MSKAEALFDIDYITSKSIENLSVNEPKWLQQRRISALEKFKTLKIDQDQLFYKYTDFKNFRPDSLSPIWDSAKENIEIPGELLNETAHFEENPWSYQSNMPKKYSQQGVFLCTLSELLEQSPTLAKKIVKVTENSSGFDKFGELAKALTKNIVVLYVPEGVKLDSKLIKRTYLGAISSAFFSEFIIYAEKDSEVSFIDYYSSESSHLQMYVHSTTVHLEDTAKVTGLLLQDFGTKLVNLGARYAQIGPYAQLRLLQQQQGSNLSRLNSCVRLIGRGSEGYDLFNSFGNERQRFDTKSELIHIAEDTIGQTHSRTVMFNNAESVLRGLIHIRETGKNADSYLVSNGLTKGKGKVVAVPALKIDQNNVMAAHAASVEPLNEDKIFYIQSRGMDKEVAEGLLIKGYFEPVTQLLKNNELESLARTALEKKWDGAKK